MYCAKGCNQENGVRKDSLFEGVRNLEEFEGNTFELFRSFLTKEKGGAKYMFNKKGAYTFRNDLEEWVTDMMSCCRDDDDFEFEPEAEDSDKHHGR